jgi:UDP-N-acetylmuramate dehydrogenase
MELDEKYNLFLKQFDGLVLKDELLSAYTTFRTGGKADLFLDVSDGESLAEGIRLARKLEIPFFIIGGGSNLLVSDSGYRGLIIRNSIRRLEVKDNEVVAGGGESLDRMVDFATECSLTGLEFAAGIWGTVGGAVCGNAGAFGSNVGNVFQWAELIDHEGNKRVEDRDYFEFGYRHSALKQTQEVVVYAGFGLESGEAGTIRKKVDEIRRLRSRKHPTTPCSAGCFFKNVDDARQPNGKLAAGQLLDDIGAKQTRVGDAAVFKEHANIIINSGQATSKDIRKLADILKKRVKEKFDIDLIEEIICLGDF